MLSRAGSKAGVTRALGLIFFVLLESGSAQFTPALLQNDSYWGDGKAEFDIYDGQIVRVGQARQCEVLHIFVRDTIEPKQSFVQRAATLPVIRMNQIFSIPIGIGVQEQSLSVFWSRDGRLAQFSFVGADSIGNVSKTCASSPDGNKFLFECHSYGDGATSQSIDRPSGNAVFYDELPFRVRTIDFSKPVGDIDIQLAASIISSKSENIVFKPAKVHFKTGDRLIDIDVRYDSGTDHFVLDRDFPFLLREWRMADGSHLRMKNSLKVDYWNYSKNGDRERAVKNPMLRHPD